MRAALHSHILCWFQPRRGKAPVLQAVPRTAPGTEPKQRPRAQKVEPLTEYQEDNMYHRAKVARVVTEMVRPYVEGHAWGGFGWSHLRVAGLARILQTKLYLHQCTTKYCLQSRVSCRFFFPWPKMPHQQFDENMDRTACQRRCEEDDQDTCFLVGVCKLGKSSSNTK